MFTCCQQHKPGAHTMSIAILPLIFLQLVSMWPTSVPPNDVNQVIGERYGQRLRHTQHVLDLKRTNLSKQTSCYLFLSSYMSLVIHLNSVQVNSRFHIIWMWEYAQYKKRGRSIATWAGANVRGKKTSDSRQLKLLLFFHNAHLRKWELRDFIFNE